MIMKLYVFFKTGCYLQSQASQGLTITKSNTGVSLEKQR